MNKFCSFLLFLIVFICLISCSQTITTVSDLNLTDKKYDADFVKTKDNIQIDKLVNTVKKVNCLAYYKSYIFRDDHLLTKDKLSNSNLDDFIESTSSSTETSSGTATIIYLYKNKIALLTCAHILDFPDTIIKYFKDSEGKKTNYIKSVSIKTKQSNFLPEFTQPNQADIIILDKAKDIALIGLNLLSDRIKPNEVLSLKAGNSKELEWGSKVYMIGYPLNYKMITTGLVSLVQSSAANFFLVDAIFNPGFSGGLVLAIRDGAPNFEIVGMIKSGTVNRNLYLKPNTESPSFNYTPKMIYNDEIIVEEETTMKYGITKIMSIETIINFIKENRKELLNYNYLPEMFFNNGVSKSAK